MSPRTPRVVVVGAGIGGLSCALLLAARGFDVTVLERAPGPGGKMRQVVAGGAPVDAGPTVFTMRWIFDEMFAEAGVRLEDQLPIAPLSVLARHAWGAEDRDRLDLHADRARSVDAIARFAGPAEGLRFDRFCDRAREVYRTLEGPYIRRQRPAGVMDMIGALGPRGLATLAGLGPFATLWGLLSRQFHDPRLRQLFGRYATYCGASPWLAPATLMLVAQVEMDGVWSVDGGMHAVALTVARLATAQGARIRYEAHVDEILVRQGRACGVRLAGGEVVAADAVVFNGDPSALADGLLGEAARRAVPPLPVAQRSLSALTWAVRAPTKGFPLARHNVFFDTDYASEFDDIFRRRRLPRRPTVYVCAQDRERDGADALAPGASERLLCLVNAPPDGDRPGSTFSAAEIHACERQTFDLLQRHGLTVERQAGCAVRTTPAQFHQLFPGSGGALYGRATHGWMALFKRPSSQSALPGLLLCGGGVHPGPGVPMAAMSGRLAAETLTAHLGSTSRSRPVATSGGTSTPSRTTASTG